MPRRLPPPHPRGAPRTPGSGRRKGTPNRKTRELRELMAALAGDVVYQQRLIKAFRTRRVHPATELRVWEYAIGKPKDQIELSARTEVSARLEVERQILLQLDPSDLEQLAAESQGLMDRAKALVEARRVPPVQTTLPRASAGDRGATAEPGESPDGVERGVADV